MQERTTLEELEANVSKRQKVYIRYAEGAKLYSMSLHSFIELANKANAVKRIGSVCIVNTTVFEEYIEKNFS